MAGYLGSVPVPQATQHRESFTCTAGQTTFNTAGYTPQFIDVYLNGVHLSPADVTATNGSDVVLAACLVNDIVDVVSYTPFEVANQTFTGTTTMTDVVAATLDISGDIDIDGVANLDNTDIDGTLDVSGQVTVADGSAGAPSISNTGDVNTGILFPAADTIAFTTGGTERLRIDDDGSLLLGQTAANNDFGDGRVFLSMKGTGSTDYSGVQMANNGTSGDDQILGLLAFYDGTTSENARIAALRESANTDAGLRFYTRPTGGSLIERVRINHDGNVGIGTAGYGTYHSTNRVLSLGSGSTIRGASSGSDPYITIANNAFHDASNWKYIHSDFASSYEQYDGTHAFNVAASGSAAGTVSFSQAMKIDANGAVTKPLQPAFQAKPASAQNNIAIDSLVTVVFGTEIFDNNADFASNTFTAPVTGRYQLNVNLYLLNLDSASEYYYLRLTTSNRVYDSIITTNRFSADAGYATLQISVLADMDASDTAYVSIVQQGGTAQTDIGAAGTNFSGYLVA